MNPLLQTGLQGGRVGQVSVHFSGALNKPSFKRNLTRLSASKEWQRRILHQTPEDLPFPTSLNAGVNQRGCPTPLEQPKPLDYSSLQESNGAIQEVRPSPVFNNRFFSRSKSCSEVAFAIHGIPQPTGPPAEPVAETSSQACRRGLKADHSIKFHRRPSMNFNSSEFSEQKVPLLAGDPSFKQPPSRAARNFLKSQTKSKKKPVLRMKMNSMFSQKIEKMQAFLTGDSIIYLNQRSLSGSSHSEMNSSSQVSEAKELGQTILTPNIFTEKRKLKITLPQRSLN